MTKPPLWSTFHWKSAKIAVCLHFSLITNMDEVSIQCLCTYSKVLSKRRETTSQLQKLLFSWQSNQCHKKRNRLTSIIVLSGTVETWNKHDIVFKVTNVLPELFYQTDKHQPNICCQQRHIPTKARLRKQAVRGVIEMTSLLCCSVKFGRSLLIEYIKNRGSATNTSPLRWGEWHENNFFSKSLLHSATLENSRLCS